MLLEPLHILLPTENDSVALAQHFAQILHTGDTLLLDGSIGAGKTAFARALIRARLGQTEDVPSPTFTIVQTYPTDDAEIWHCDLYRLSHPDEAIELGLDAAFEDAICLIEWPDRLGNLTPPSALTLHFVAGDPYHVTITGPSEWANRLAVLQ